MTDIPLASQFNDPTTTEGQFKRAFATLLTALTEIKKVTDLVNTGLPTTNVLNALGVSQDTLNQQYATAISTMVKLSDLTTALNKKADSATTAAGYGIIDVLTVDKTYSRSQIDDLITALTNSYQSGSKLSNMVTAYATLDQLKASTGVDGRTSYVTNLGWYRYDGTSQSWKLQLSNAAGIDSGVGGQALIDFNNAVSLALSKKADAATTLSGYGITDTYRKADLDTILAKKLSLTDASQVFEPLISALGTLGISPTWNPIPTVANVALGTTIAALSGRTDWLKQKTVAVINSVTQLNALTDMTDGQSYFVSGEGIFKYVLASKTWVKQLGFNDYDFKNEQAVQYYYDLLGNWDDAIFQAQVNVYLKNYSPTLILPRGTIEVTRPILFNEALYYKINALYPDLKIFNPATQSFGKAGSDSNFYTTAWRLIGQGKPAQIGEGYHYSTNSGIGGGTTIQFIGGYSILDNPTDTTWMNYGIIHCAPDFGGYQNAKPSDYWENKDDLSGFNRIEIKDLAVEGNGRNIHGIVIWRSHWHLISDVAVDNCYGAGIFMQWLYDLNIDRVVFTRCGRMSPTYKQYIDDQLFDVQYQTYAPLHITAQRPSTDNANYIGVFRPHFENNFRCVADVILNGNANPVWITNAHHETGSTVITTGGKLKVTYVVGKYGVQYFAKDSESTFDYKNQVWNEAGGYLTVQNCYGYTTGYSHAGVVSRYSGVSYFNFHFTGKIEVNGQDASAWIRLSDCILGDISVGGGLANDLALQIDNSVVSSVSVSYAPSISIVDTVVTNAITLDNINVKYNHNNSVIRNVTAASIKGDLRGGTIQDLTLTDANTVNGPINSIGVLPTVSHSGYFEGWLAK